MGYKVNKHTKRMKQDIEKIVRGFDWNRVGWRDKEYLTAMVNDTISSKSFKDSGQSFDQKYPGAGDFVLFNNKNAASSYGEEFYHAASMASHYLHPHPKGRKYWLVWSFTPNENS